MHNRFKGIINALIILSYILMIGELIIDKEQFIYKENYLFYLNILLLCIGFYYFVEANNKN